MNATLLTHARWKLRLAALLLAGCGTAVNATAAPQRGTAIEPPQHLLCADRLDPLAVAEAHPLLSWGLQPSDLSQHGVRASAWQIRVATSREGLAAGTGLTWDSGQQASALNALPAASYQGRALEPGQPYWWQVRVWDGEDRPTGWSQPAHFRVAPTWRAQWIAAQATDAEAGQQPMPLFRKQFQLEAPIRSATLHIAGLGQFEAQINGTKVGRGELAPGWSDYKKTIFYDSLDVTALLHRGVNAIGVMLGNGMFRVQQTKGRYTKLTGSYGPPQLTAQLHVELANGKTVELTTDTSWKTAAGPIVYTSIYGGEDYDARREQSGWTKPGFNDAAWAAATSVAGPTGKLVPELAPLSTIQRHYPPVSTTGVKPGVKIYDLGQNFAGWPALTAKGPAGATVKLIPGELLNPDGTVSQRSSGAPMWFSYTLKGAEVERWHPQFSYYGFRYLQVETSGGAEVTELEGQSVYSSSPVAGNFESSSKLLNQIHALILRSIENNAQSVLTDCPHREKLGWLEQTYLLAPSILFDFDFRGIYRALGQNLADTQKPDGSLPEIAPQYVVFGNKWGPFDDSPEWGSAVVLAPWSLYQRTGEVEPLLAQREAMRRYVDYLGTRAEGGIIPYGLGDWYDIGPKPPGVSQLTTAGVTATAIYYQDLTVLARVLQMAGETAASKHYAETAESVRASFNATFYDKTLHRYDKGSQTAQAMPLALGMEPAGEHEAVLKTLIEEIHAHNNHVTAGDIGYRYVVDALTANHRSEVLLQMLERTDTPSYGYQLAQGATALTEAWDANPVNSQDHFMLGDAEEWFYRGLGGIQIDHAAPQHQQVVIAPEVVGELQWVKSSYNSTWGMIASSWRRQSDVVTYSLEVPANTVATIRLQTAHPEAVTVNGTAVEHADGVNSATRTTSGVELVVGSGSYQIVAAAPVKQNQQTTGQDKQ